MLHQVYLGLGSNLGDRERLIRQAIQLIGERVGQVTRQSSLLETAPWGFASDHQFLNGVVCCETSLTPRQVLSEILQIEQELGRRRPTSVRSGKNRCGASAQQALQYADRPIDIDILLYDDLTVDEPDLKIPHPLMRERDFVMKPLQEILTHQTN